MFILGVIPARSGSKGIPFKNIQLLNGKPLIRYTYEAAQHSDLDAIMVTTDSGKILEHCYYTGIDREFLSVQRPPELAQDDTPMLPVIQHAVDHAMQEYGKKVDAVMTLQPTSPLRTTAYINKAIRMFKAFSSTSECLVSVCEGVHPMKSYDAHSKPFMDQTPYDKHKNKCYARNGAIFITSIKLLNEGKLFDDNPLLCHMQRSCSIDIDSYDDLRIAEALLRLEANKND